LADRVVKVTLQAQVANYIAGMQQAQRETNKTSKTSADAKASFEAQNQAMTQLGVGLLAMGALAAAGVGLAIKKYAEFDQAMSEVQASTHESEVNMGKLRDAAIEAGARTVFSATEAANAIDELAKAGLSTADILGGALDGALSLASAGGLQVADAAQIAATALTQFKLEGKDVPHVADLLAAGAGKAQGSVEDLSQALNQGGLVASQAGFSIEETTGVLAAFASAGLKGSDAGTSLKTAILALESPSTKAAAVMDQYGINVYDSSGKMLSFAGIADQLKTKLGGLTDEQRNSALATIFGTDAVRSASVLYANGGKGIDEWNKKVNDSGYAAETARLKLNNLNGDLEQLGGSFDTALIKSGSAANDVLRGIVQSATAAVNAFGDAPPLVQGTALALGALAAATLLAGGAFLVAVPKLAQFATGLEVLKDSTMPGVASAAGKIEGAVGKAGTALRGTAAFLTGPWGTALAVAALGVQALSNYLDSLKASSEEMSNSVKTASSALDIFKTASQGQDATHFIHPDTLGKLRDLNKVLDESAKSDSDFSARFSNETRSYYGAFDALKAVGTQLGALAGTDLPAAQNSFRVLADATDGSRKKQWELLSSMPDYKKALIEQASAQGIQVTSTNEATNKTNLLKLAFGAAEQPALKAADAYLKAADESAGLDKKLQGLIETINAANGVGQDAVSANIAYGDALAQVDDYIAKARAGTEGYTLTLDQATQAGRDNYGNLVDTAAKYQDAAKAQFDLDHNTGAYVASLQAGRDAVLQRAKDLGATDEQLKYISDHITEMPSEKDIKVLLDSASAYAEIDRVKAAISSIQRNIDIAVKVNGAQNLATTGGIKARFASGGMVPGTPSHKDNMVATVASGEFITRTAQAQIPANRAALEYMNAGGVIRGYASGGYVGGTYAAPQYARTSGGGQNVLNITVPVSAGVVSNDDLLAKTVVRAVTGAVKNGAIPRGWNV